MKNFTLEDNEVMHSFYSATLIAWNMVCNNKENHRNVSKFGVKAMVKTEKTMEMTHNINKNIERRA